MWDDIDVETGVLREAELKKRYWNLMIRCGATVGRFDMDDPKSAWTIVDNIIEKKQQIGQPLRLQEELVDLGKRLNETNVGKILCRDLQGLLDMTMGTVESLEWQVKRGRTDVNEELVALHTKVKKLSQEIKSMEIHLDKRVAYSSIKKLLASM